MKSLRLLLYAAVMLGLANAAQATIVQGPTFSGNECAGGGFATCFATTTGTNHDGVGSPTIYKRDSGGGQDFGSFPSINGSEFLVTYNGGTNTLSFTYTPGPGDPEIHYFVVNQANSSVLFYDLTSPILTDTLALDPLFPGHPGFSHITFFDTGSTPVPEPGSLAVIGAALFGFSLLRRKRRE